MAIKSITSIVGDLTGGTFPVEIVSPNMDIVYLSFPTGTLLSDYYLTYQTAPIIGQMYSVVLSTASVTLGGNAINVFGVSIDAVRLSQILLTVNFQYIDLVGGFPIIKVWYDDDVNNAQTISGAQIFSNSLPLSTISGMTSAQIIVADGSNVAQAVTMSGDVTIDASGVTAIGAGKVTNTQLAGSIARTKLASGTADRVLTNNGAGAYTELAQLTAKLGGLGVDNSGATGFVTFNAGTASVNAFTDTNHVNVSFETGYVGDFKVKMGFAGTVTSAYAFLTKTIGAVDAVITIKNNAGTTMGSITFTASDAKGTAQTVAISANNTFSAGDVLTFTTSGGSTTGEALVSYSFTRNS